DLSQDRRWHPRPRLLHLPRPRLRKELIDRLVVHGQQIAVAQYNLESGDFGVGAQHEEAIESGIGLDLGAIDDEAVAFGRLQETTEALVGDERLVALGELALESGDEFGGRRGIFLRFLRVAPDDIA